MASTSNKKSDFEHVHYLVGEPLSIVSDEALSIKTESLTSLCSDEGLYVEASRRKPVEGPVFSGLACLLEG